MSKYKWSELQENECQLFYDCKIGKDYLCVLALKKYPERFFCNYTKEGMGTVTVMDKSFNDRQRKKEEKSGAIKMGISNMPNTVRILESKDIEYLKRKLVTAYENGLVEIKC